MPHAMTKDNVRLHVEEAGRGTPIIFLHEFAADHTNWEPQMRYFSRGQSLHRLFRARLHAVRCAAERRGLQLQAFLHRRACGARPSRNREGTFRRPLDGLLSSLQIGLNAPERALSMTLAAVGSGSALENLDAFRAQCPRQCRAV